MKLGHFRFFQIRLGGMKRNQKFLFPRQIAESSLILWLSDDKQGGNRCEVRIEFLIVLQPSF